MNLTGKEKAGRHSTALPANNHTKAVDKMKDGFNVAKAAFSAVTGFLSSFLGILYVPVYLMAACNIIDYITGLMAAPYRQDRINSYTGMRGIAKKVTMWLLVVVGAIVDQLIIYASGTLGFDMQIHFLAACIVAVWIICNELISILENMIDIGVSLPGFLMPLVKHIKGQVDDIADFEEKER